MDRELRLSDNPGVAWRTEHSGTITAFNIHTSAAIRGVSRETNNKAVQRKSENLIINKLNIDNFRKKKKDNGYNFQAVCSDNTVPSCEKWD